MQIVINIDEEDYKVMKHNIAVNNPLCPLSQEEMVSKVANGTPLQKGHGDLIDISNLKYIFDLTREDSIYSGKDIERAIKSMKTIIKADKESEEV